MCKNWNHGLRLQSVKHQCILSGIFLNDKFYFTFEIQCHCDCARKITMAGLWKKNIKIFLYALFPSPMLNSFFVFVRGCVLQQALLLFWLCKNSAGGCEVPSDSVISLPAVPPTATTTDWPHVAECVYVHTQGEGERESEKEHKCKWLHTKSCHSPVKHMQRNINLLSNKTRSG